MIVGILVILLSTLMGSRSARHDEEKKVEVKGGGVVMIGPVPIIFGSDARWTVIAVLLAIALIILSLLFSLGVL